MKLPHRVQMSVVEEYEDGSTIQIDFEDAPLPANDPYVRSRLRPIGRTSSSEIITEFAPAPTRPLTYPAGLPFVEKRHVWTTESPDGSVSPGARWPCQDPDAVIAAVIDASRSDGWLLAPALPIGSSTVQKLVAVLTRRGTTRELTNVEADGTYIIHPSDLLGDPPDADGRRHRGSS
jgi:hypothetical protein